MTTHARLGADGLQSLSLERPAHTTIPGPFSIEEEGRVPVRAPALNLDCP
jgi:hypothetical protein